MQGILPHSYSLHHFTLLIIAIRTCRETWLKNNGSLTLPVHAETVHNQAFDQQQLSKRPRKVLADRLREVNMACSLKYFSPVAHYYTSQPKCARCCVDRGAGQSRPLSKPCTLLLDFTFRNIFLQFLIHGSLNLV